MQTSILHDGGASFDERTAFLQVALGTISSLKRFRELLEKYAPPRAASLEAALPATEAERAALDLVLGLVSVSQHLMDYLELARTRRATPFAEAAGATPRAAQLAPRDLLECPS